MKRIITLLFILFSVTTWAQQDQLTVVKVEQNLFDLTAKTHQKKDNNGVPGALLRVQVPLLKGLTFKGNVLSSTHQTGEYLVYVAVNTRKLTLTHQNFVPLTIDFEKYDITIESKGVYVIRLQLPANYNTGYNIITTSQYLEFQTVPANAVVVVNGEEWTSHKKYVPFGIYDYVISAGGYRSDTGFVRVEDPKHAVIVTDTLRSIFGTLHISDPTHKFDGATVFVDDIARGELPIKPIKLPNGLHQIHVRKSMYKTFTKTIEIVDGQDIIITPSLDANFQQVSLSVLNDPQAEIFIDGNKMGTNSWSGILEIGTHYVETRRARCYPRAQEIEVTLDGKTDFMLNSPIPKLGSINVESIPEGAEIYIDGESTHQLTPCLLTDIYVGNYSITLRHDQAEEKSFLVTVEEGKTTHCSSMLRRSHKVTIKMNVPSAELYIDSVRKGQITSNITTILYDEHKYGITLKAEGYRTFRDSIDPNFSVFYAEMLRMPSESKMKRMEHYPTVGKIRVNWFSLNFELGTNIGAHASLLNTRFHCFEILPLQVGIISPIYQIGNKVQFPLDIKTSVICYEPEIRLHMPASKKYDWYFGGGFLCPISQLSNKLTVPGISSTLPMIEGINRKMWFLVDFGFEKIGKVGTFNMFLRYNGGVALCMGFSLGTGFCKPPMPIFD